MMTWASQSVDNPMPISYNLYEISEIILTHFEEDEENPTYIAFLEALGNYCEYLLRKGKLTSCQEPPLDRIIVPKYKEQNGQCRICDSTCGGNFSTFGGYVDTPNEAA